jgi:processive 1,2-diacylglycerol beta-glucosyltransferase
MKPCSLILTAGFGEGHNAAARAIASACDAQHGSATAHVADAFALASPRLNQAARSAYLGMINRTPGIWSHAYQWLDRSTLFPRLLQLMSGEIRVLADLIESRSPTAICSTYPIYAFLLATLARQGRQLPPCFNVVTDSISINSLWWRAGAARWFLPNEASADVLRAAGIENRKLQVTGFPVQGYFHENTGRLAPPDLCSGTIPRVLYIINSATHAAAQTARQLLAQTEWDITCTVGRNAALGHELTSLAATRAFPSRILGWTDEIPSLLMTNHVVISKAGGATTQEALAARCPMIVNQIVPGQEEGNFELLRRHGIGTLAQTPKAVIAALERAFANDGRVWREWREAITPLSKPEAAREIAAALSEIAEVPLIPEPIPLPFQRRAASA